MSMVNHMQKLATCQYIARVLLGAEVAVASVALVESKLHVFFEVRSRSGGVPVRNGVLHRRRGRGKTRAGSADSHGNNSF